MWHTQGLELALDIVALALVALALVATGRPKPSFAFALARGSFDLEGMNGEHGNSKLGLQ